jgi:hypothetical protein
MRSDIKIDELEDLFISSSAGDFIIDGDTIRQNIYDIMVATKGSWRENRILGLDMYNYQNGFINPVFLKKEIRVQLESDNMKLLTLDVNNLEDIKINAIER